MRRAEPRARRGVTSPGREPFSSRCVRPCKPDREPPYSNQEPPPMRTGRHEKHGGSEKQGTGIASKLRQTHRTESPVTAATGRPSRRRAPRRGRTEADSTRNQQRPSTVAAIGQHTQARSSRDGISPESLPHPPGGPHKSVDTLHSRKAPLVEVNDRPASSPSKKMTMNTSTARRQSAQPAPSSTAKPAKATGPSTAIKVPAPAPSSTPTRGGHDGGPHTPGAPGLRSARVTQPRPNASSSHAVTLPDSPRRARAQGPTVEEGATIEIGRAHV